MSDIDQLKQELIKYKQVFLHLEDSIYELQISLNKMVSILDDILSEDKSGAV